MDRDIGREYIRKCDMDRAFPFEAYEKAAKLGFHSLLVPESDGGDGADVFSYALLCEALSCYGVDFSVAIAGGIFTAMNLSLHGTEDQKQRFLKPFMRGEIRFPISMSEPNAGSDVANVQTRAERVDDDYVVNGQKLWCSGAGNRGAVILMLVRTANTPDKRDGLSVLIVPNDLPGMTIRPLNTLARRSITTTEIFLDNVRVPAINMLGAEGDGFKIIAGEHLALERIAVASSNVGNAQGAVDDALAYAQQRIQFGKPIYEFQVIRHMLADMQTQVDAARLLTYRSRPWAARWRQVPQGGCDGQALCIRDAADRLAPGHADHGRARHAARVRHGALLPRRHAVHDRRRHLPDPAHDHCAGNAGVT